jgi:HD domain/Polymorphic toxin system, DSP-PTPase phosphatase
MSEDRADTANLLKAIEFASRKHSTQRRKDKDASPYINHPIAVTHLLADTGGVTDLVTLMAAVLHDTIEDTKTTAEELEAQFGRTVRKVVEEVTDNKSLEKAARKQRQIDHAPNLSKRAKTIKLEADPTFSQPSGCLNGLLDIQLRLPIRDVSVPQSPDKMREILDTIDAALSAKRIVYVHCWGGVGRTGTVIGCHLVRQGYVGDAALTRLHELFAIMDKSAFRRSPETAEQEQWVRTWREPEQPT